MLLVCQMKMYFGGQTTQPHVPPPLFTLVPLFGMFHLGKTRRALSAQEAFRVLHRVNLPHRCLDLIGIFSPLSVSAGESGCGLGSDSGAGRVPSLRMRQGARQQADAASVVRRLFSCNFHSLLTDVTHHVFSVKQTSKTEAKLMFVVCSVETV